MIENIIVIDAIIQLQQTGFALARQDTGLANLHRRGLVKSSVCECGQQQTISRIDNTCPLTQVVYSVLHVRPP